MSDPLSGGCRCGQVRFDIQMKAPLETRMCHCRDCQYASGGPFSVVAFFPVEHVSINDGGTSEYTVEGSMGLHVKRSFCTACGTPLWSKIAEIPTLICMKTGAFDQPELVQPTGQMWCDSKVSWLRVNEELEQLPGNPPIEQYL